jgi:hypothetical protein
VVVSVLWQRVSSADEVEVLRVFRGCTGPVVGAHQGHSAVYNHRLGMRSARSIVYPNRHASGSQRIDATCPSARGRLVGDYPHVNAALFGPDQRPDDAGTDGQAVGTNKDVVLGSLDRLDREGVAVLFGWRADLGLRSCVRLERPPRSLGLRKCQTTTRLIRASGRTRREITLGYLSDHVSCAGSMPAVSSGDLRSQRLIGTARRSV